MERRPLVIGIIAALFSCVVLLGCVAVWLFTVLALPSGTVYDTPAPVATSVSGPVQTAVPGATLPASTPGTVPTPATVPLPTRVPDAASADAASLKALLAANIDERDQSALTVRLKKVKGPIPAVVNATPPSYKVGDQRVLWIADQPAKKQFTVTASVRYVTPHVIAWVANGERVDDAALKKSVDVFETKIYPTNREFFGSEPMPGLDNDTHLNIFNGNVPGVGGYFSSADEFPSIVNPYSNQGEWFYINTRDVRPGTADYESVLAHEFQHMIHFANDRNEDTWVNEGLSELAMRLNNYSVGGSDRAFVRDPDIQLNAWRDEPNDSVPHYGASYVFNAYFLERFGEAMVREFVREPANGIVGYNLVLQRNKTGVTFDDVFQDWLIANVLNNSTVDKRYAYKDLPSIVRIQNAATNFPFNKTLAVHQYAGQYIDIKPARTGDYTLKLQGATSVRIANTDPHSGGTVWYSNRGDDSDMTLTRPFDLSGVKSATLSAWLWYDIEKDFDYAYVEVSTDNGATWNSLKSARTTDTNPNGNSYGNAFTGRDSQWVQETFDLTPYAGQKVLVRFEYITDDAFNATGLLVDDISIPELNYTDDVEGGDGGWVANGFVRVNNFLPQTYSVQLIKIGAKTTVEPVTLDARNAATITLKNFGGDVNRAILVISGLTPVTTEATNVTVSISSP
ncbi:MAG: immune inhibitor A [Chloroflexi bacterium]|nr:immune inhibitor A [Chloroflexota bacterium]